MGTSASGRDAKQGSPHGPRQLAVTTEGGTWFSTEVAAHANRREVEAHEAVHRAQFALEGDLPTGSGAQLEDEAVRGARELLKGGSFAPRLAAPRGSALSFPGTGEEPATATVETAQEPAYAPAWVQHNLTAEEREKLGAFGEQNYQRSLKVLDQILRRLRRPSRPGRGRQQVQTRSEGGELRVIVFLLRSKNVEAIILLPSERGSRSPDAYVRFTNGAEDRVEVTSLTQAQRGVYHSTVVDARGRETQRIPRTSSNQVLLQAAALKPEQIEAAIRRKIWPARGESQLEARSRSLERSGVPTVAKGIVVVDIAIARMDRAELDGVMSRLSAELLAEPTVTEIWIMCRLVGERARRVLRYERSSEFALARVERTPSRGTRGRATAAESSRVSERAGEGGVTRQGVTARVGENPIKRVGEPGFVEQFGTVSRPPTTAQRVVGAGGAALVLIDLLNWYSSLDSSEMSRAASAYRNAVFRRMGGEARHFLGYTIYLPPVGETLVRWFEEHVTTWRQFHRLWNWDARGLLHRSKNGWVWRVGRSENDYVSIDAEVRWLFGELDRRTVVQSVKELLRGTGLVRFRDSLERDDRKVWANEGRGLPMHLLPLASGSILPEEPRFFVRGQVSAWRGASIGAFAIVEGADVGTVRAMQGESGLVDPEDLVAANDAPTEPEG